MPGGMNAGRGQGMGMGRGGGRNGRGGFEGMNMAPAPGTDYVAQPAEAMPRDMPVQAVEASEIDLLRREIASLSRALSDVAERIGNLEQRKAVETPVGNDDVESEE
jgi:hypothetical protein